MSDEILNAVEELLPFLDVLTPAQYKHQILEHLLGMTGTNQGVTTLANHVKMLDKFIDLINNDKDEKTRVDSLKILVNLTSGSIAKPLEKKLMTDDFICFLLRVLTVENAESADMCAMLLSNVTVTEQNCTLVMKCIENDEMISFEKFVEIFSLEEFNKHCNLHHVGTFISNLTVLNEVRKILLGKEKNLICRFLPFTQYKTSSVRRMAAARIIKNCLFDTDCHSWLLSEDVDIIPHLLLPLAGSEEFKAEENDELPLDLQYLPPDKKREENQDIIILLLEALFQLCATKDCRLLMKTNGSYYILREFHKTISDDNTAVMHPLENLVQILIGDEPDDKEHDNFKEVQIPDHIAKKFESTM